MTKMVGTPKKQQISRENTCEKLLENFQDAVKGTEVGAVLREQARQEDSDTHVVGRAPLWLWVTLHCRVVCKRSWKVWDLQSKGQRPQDSGVPALLSKILLL